MKYKLIKEYPGSPPLGTVVDKEQRSKSYFFRSGDKNICVLNNHVENNPEYWEEFIHTGLVYKTARNLVLNMLQGTGIDFYDSVQCSIIAVDELIELSRDYDNHSATLSSQVNFLIKVRDQLQKL